MLHHDLTKVVKRRLAGVRREEAKAKLKNVSAGVLRRQLYGSEATDKEALDLANITEVQNLNVYRIAKHEVNWF